MSFLVARFKGEENILGVLGKSMCRKRIWRVRYDGYQEI